MLATEPRRNSFLSLLLLTLLLSSARGRSSENFYPIGIYAVPKTNDLLAIRAAGFNLVANGVDDSYLAAAERAGLKVLARPSTSVEQGFVADKARAAISAWDSHAALWAWYLVDEPDRNQISPTEVRRAQEIIKGFGARKPTALTLYQGSSALHYANIADVLMIDRYPVPWLPLANFPQHVRMARLALGPRKPLIAVIQAHDWSYYPDLVSGEKNLRPPTYDELRCMTYCALAQRANGLFYYCFDDGHWKVLQHPETWQSLKRVVSEVNERLALFEGEHLWWPHVHRFKDARFAFNEALESSITPALLRVTSGKTAVPNGRYMLAVNNTGRKHLYGFYLAGASLEAIPVLGEDRDIITLNGWVEDEFEAYAVHVYGPLPEFEDRPAPSGAKSTIPQTRP